MIIDKLENSKLYYGISDNLRKAFVYLESTNLKDLPSGKYEIDGSNVYALVKEYEGKPIESGKLEAHKRYIDVQFIVSGAEIMGYSNLNNLSITQEYDEAYDRMYLKGDGDFFTISAGSFALFFPEEAHMPDIVAKQNVKTKKVVVKILFD